MAWAKKPVGAHHFRPFLGSWEAGLMCFTPTRRHHRQKPTFTFKRTVYDA